MNYNKPLGEHASFRLIFFLGAAEPRVEYRVLNPWFYSRSNHGLLSALQNLPDAAVDIRTLSKQG